MKYLKEAQHILLLVFGILTIYQVTQLFSSEVEGNVTLLGKDSDGHFRVLEVNGKKSAVEDNKNLLSIDVDADGSRSIDYKRQIMSVGGIKIYGGGGYRDGKDGSRTYRAGITIGF